MMQVISSLNLKFHPQCHTPWVMKSKMWKLRTRLDIPISCHSPTINIICNVPFKSSFPSSKIPTKQPQKRLKEINESKLKLVPKKHGGFMWMMFTTSENTKSPRKHLRPHEKQHLQANAKYLIYFILYHFLNTIIIW